MGSCFFCELSEVSEGCAVWGVGWGGGGVTDKVGTSVFEAGALPETPYPNYGEREGGRQRVGWRVSTHGI